MEQYRKSDQYYIDEYDKKTIQELKELEKLMDEAEKQCQSNSDNLPDYLSKQIKYIDTGVSYARNKNQSVRENIAEDERKDQLLQKNPIPENVRCNTCNALMDFKSHDFIGHRNGPLIYFFSCPNNHLPMKTVYANGNPYLIPKATCTYCGGELVCKTRKTKMRLILTDKCQQCGKTDSFKINIAPKKILPIDENDRKKYCTDFIGRRTSYEDLKSLAALGELFDNQQEKDTYNFSQLKMLNIVQLEETLVEKLKEEGLQKFQFEKPKDSNRFLTVNFSAVDNKNREKTKSIKALKKIIETQLFHSNWRLMSPGISYNLAFLSGQLKGYSLEEDLLKIAREIHEKTLK
ncbi:MAG: hypothetical protein KF862_12300 [Chitinophagaceae bacterium]|nr:hypothetical protein [Chitinophagaceae bacterium]